MQQDGEGDDESAFSDRFWICTDRLWIHAKQVADPSSITLDAALNDVADSLYQLRQKTLDRDKVGLAVDEVSVTFNVSARANNTGTATANASISPPMTGGTGGLMVSNTLINEGIRGNQVVVKFKNLATADLTKGALVKGKDGKPMVDPRCNRPNPPKELGCPEIMFRKN
jgi:hypothetical protein